MTDYTGWVHYDGCAICPDCNGFISCPDEITGILAAADSHQCVVEVYAQTAAASGGKGIED